MIRLQQTQTMPDNDHLKMIGSILVNWLHKYCLADFKTIQTMRDTLKSNPAAALKHAANTIVTVVEQRKGI